MISISVPDMSCGHCKASVEAALARVAGADDVVVDVPARRVTVSGTATTDVILSALAEAGYPAQIVAA